MQFTASAAAFLALIGRAVAQTAGFDAITSPTSGQVLEAGSTVEVKWDYNAQYAGTISITLLEGATPETLELGPTLATGIDNSLASYSWTVGSDLGADATYGLKISLDADPATFQYSFPFKIDGSSSSSSASASASTPAASSAPSAPASSTPSGLVATTTTLPLSTTLLSTSQTWTTSYTASAANVTDTDTAAGSSSATASSSSSPTGATKPAESTTGGAASQTTAVAPPAGASPAGSTGYPVPGTTSTSPYVVTAGAGRATAGTMAALCGLGAALVAMYGV